MFCFKFAAALIGNSIGKNLNGRGSDQEIRMAGTLSALTHNIAGQTVEVA